jgi:tRNA U34 2-thiouridine synthase MnmA/TrmU
VVGPYADDHGAGRTPNPCIECNRHIKFAAVDERARELRAALVAWPGAAEAAIRVMFPEMATKSV